MKDYKNWMKAICFSLLIGSGAFAANPANNANQKITPKQRQEMAQAHEKMAACLRSDKPVNQCRQEMMKSCQKMMSEGGCMMGSMGEMGGMHGGMGAGMTRNQPSDAQGGGHGAHHSESNE